MIADERLDLNKYIGYAKPDAKIKTNFGDQYRTDATTSIGGQYPWDPGRFNTTDILNRAQARKRSLNAHLGYVDPDEPLDTQLFIGLGRFVRHNDYDFNKGNPITDHKPQDNPDFNPVWVEAYKISPTIPPNKRAKSPMPTAANPDPHGYIMQMAQQRAEDTVDPQPSVAGLLSKSKKPILDKELNTEEPKEVFKSQNA
jgi:hypothetical protein